MLKRLAANWQAILLLILTTLFGVEKAPQAYEYIKQKVTTEATFATTPAAGDTITPAIGVEQFDTLTTDLSGGNEVDTDKERSFIVFIEITYQRSTTGDGRPSTNVKDATWVIGEVTTTGTPTYKLVRGLIPKDAKPTGQIYYINQNYFKSAG